MRITVGTLAKLCGVNLQTVRYYEREKLLPEPQRLDSGYRVYSADAVRRLRFIKRAQQLGFSLAEIRELLAIGDNGDCSEILAITQAKISQINEKIRTLQRMNTILNRLARRCPGCGPPSQCPILESIDSDDVPYMNISGSSRNMTR